MAPPAFQPAKDGELSRSLLALRPRSTPEPAAAALPASVGTLLARIAGSPDRRAGGGRVTLGSRRAPRHPRSERSPGARSGPLGAVRHPRRPRVRPRPSGVRRVRWADGASRRRVRDRRSSHLRTPQPARPQTAQRRRPGRHSPVRDRAATGHPVDGTEHRNDAAQRARPGDANRVRGERRVVLPNSRRVPFLGQGRIRIRILARICPDESPRCYLADPRGLGQASKPPVELLECRGPALDRVDPIQDGRQVRRRSTTDGVEDQGVEPRILRGMTRCVSRCKAAPRVLRPMAGGRVGSAAGEVSRCRGVLR